MRIIRTILFVIMTVQVNFSFSQDTIKVMWYNILNYPEINSARINYLQTILQHVKPDIFVVCEITSVSGASTILNSALNVGTTSYAMVNYTDGPDDENMLFYNTEKLGFIDQNEIPASPRQLNEYILYYKNPNLTAASDTAYLYLYACHLKASSDSQSAAERAAATATLRSYLSTRTNAENTIVGGDMNIYGSGEAAYINLTSETQANLYDPVTMPVPTPDWNDYANRMYHTQSTRTVQIDGGSDGGLDDRFDMMLFSDDIRYGTNGIQFITNSYKAVGQDGNRYNGAINSPSNTSVPANVVNALYYMSDHLPVYMDLKVGGEVGIEEQTWLEDHVMVYPNPIEDVMYVDTEGLGEVEVELVDMSGRVMVSLSSFESWSRIDVSSFAEGSYLLRVTSKIGTVNKHVVIR